MIQSALLSRSELHAKDVATPNELMSFSISCLFFFLETEIIPYKYPLLLAMVWWGKIHENMRITLFFFSLVTVLLCAFCTWMILFWLLLEATSCLWAQSRWLSGDRTVGDEAFWFWYLNEDAGILLELTSEPSVPAGLPSALVLVFKHILMAKPNAEQVEVQGNIICVSKI